MTTTRLHAVSISSCLSKIRHNKYRAQALKSLGKLLATMAPKISIAIAAAALILVQPRAAEAHMAMTITPPGGALTYPRSKATIFDTYRTPNHPSAGAMCHGVNPTSTKIALTAGQTVVGSTTFGAGHNVRRPASDFGALSLNSH